MAARFLGSSVMFLLLGSFVICFIPAAKADPPLICPSDMKEGCLRTCFGHCDQMSSLSEMCTLECKNGCECNNPTMVRASETDSTCVPASSCDVPCPDNMHFDTSFMGSDPTCVKGQFTMSLPTASPRCACNEGYVRNIENTKCIDPSECPTDPEGQED